jgi:hypothetical protein
MATAANIADISAVKITQVSTLLSVFACVYVYMPCEKAGLSVCLSAHL